MILRRFQPVEVIPTGVGLGPRRRREGFLAVPIRALVDNVAAGRLHVPVSRAFRLDTIVEAHRTMEANTAGGKIVVLTR